MAKKSWFKFYPQSWLGDSELRTLGPEIRGFWIDLLCHMSQANPVGYLVNAAGEPLRVDAISRLIGIPIGHVEVNLKVLLAHKICSFDGNFIFSRKMVRDHAREKKLAQSGCEAAKRRYAKDEAIGTPIGKAMGTAIGLPIQLDILDINTDYKKGSNKKEIEKEEDKSSSKEKEKKEAVKTPSSCPPEGDTTPHLKIIALWHEVCHMLPKVNEKLWDGNRAVLLRSRWKQRKEFQSLEFWRQFFLLVASSPFLSGQVTMGNGRAFQATLAWCIKAENFKKILEGTYKPRTTTSAEPFPDYEFSDGGRS